MPVSIANCFNSLAPMVEGIYGYLILGEKVSKWDIIGFFVAIMGVIILNDPIGFGDQDL